MVGKDLGIHLLRWNANLKWYRLHELQTCHLCMSVCMVSRSFSSSGSRQWTHLLSDGSCSSPVVSSEQNHPQSHPVQSMHRHRSLRLDGVCNHQSSQQDTWKERSHCIVTVTMANYYSSALVSVSVTHVQFLVSLMQGPYIYDRMTGCTT